MTARVLADYFDHVTLLERDQIEDRPVLHKSIPQGNHLHGLLQGGQQVLSALYPGLPQTYARWGPPAQVLAGISSGTFSTGKPTIRPAQ